MGKVTSPTREVLRRLGDYLKERTSLAQISLEWPEANVQLKYPALTIFAGEPTITPQPVTQWGEAVPETVAAPKGKVLWHVGDFDWKLQLDVWVSSKEERHKLFQELFEAFNSMLPITGLSLSLLEYHNVFCRYDLTSIVILDGEEQSQRKEWRIKAEVLANCEAIVVKTEKLITQSEVTFDDYVSPEEETLVNFE